MWRAQRSARVFDASMKQARMYSPRYRPTPQELAELRSAITRRDGPAFLHLAAGFVEEHRRQRSAVTLPPSPATWTARRPPTSAGARKDPYEHRQIPATRERVEPAEILTIPGGLTTSEHPDLLAAAIREAAHRHGVGTPITANG
jgi:hypothetical protein